MDDALAAPNADRSRYRLRDYQARNFMREPMRVDDGVLFYHSSCARAGHRRHCGRGFAPYPDPTQFEPNYLL